MDRVIVAMMFAFAACEWAMADPNATETVVDFQWSGDDMATLNRSPAFNGNPFQQSVELGGVISEPPRLTIKYALQPPLQLTIRTLGSAITSRVTAKKYAIAGKVSYEGVAAGSYLEMGSYFAPVAPGGSKCAYFSRTLSYGGPMAKLEGTDDGRDFLLPFDATGASAKLDRLEFNLHLTGPGTIHLWNVKLVQYCDAPESPPSLQPTATAPVAAASPQAQERVVAELAPEKSNAALVPLPNEAHGWQVTDPAGSLWVLSDPLISATHFAVVGDIQYKDVSDGYLELTANFASEEPGLPGPSLVLRASDDIGPLARLRGSTPDWTPFWLPFDSSQQKSRLTSLVVNLNLADRGNVYLRNVRLVQYPDGTFPKSLAPSGTIPPPQPLYPAAVGEATRPASPGIDWKSFLLGAATTGLALLAVTGLIFVSRLWQRRHHERELRRIASLDS